MKQDPLLWWKKNVPLYPILACSAHDVLAIPGKSVNLFYFTHNLNSWLCKVAQSLWIALCQGAMILSLCVMQH